MPNLELFGESALMDFFGITRKQFFQCFVPKKPIAGFGKKNISVYYQPKDIAYNIYSLLEPIFHYSKRIVLVEKFQDNVF